LDTIEIVDKGSVDPGKFRILYAAMVALLVTAVAGLASLVIGACLPSSTIRLSDYFGFAFIFFPIFFFWSFTTVFKTKNIRGFERLARFGEHILRRDNR
jgi:hypothetical protein